MALARVSVAQGERVSAAARGDGARVPSFAANAAAPIQRAEQRVPHGAKVPEHWNHLRKEKDVDVYDDGEQRFAEPRWASLEPAEAAGLDHDRIKLLEDLREREPQATVTDLLLQKSDHARELTRKFVEQRGETGETDLMMLHSLLATRELHKSGGMQKMLYSRDDLTEDERGLRKLMEEPYGRGPEIMKTYGLNQAERRAIEGYTDAHKGERKVSGQPNERYMGQHAHWGEYGDGWTALKSAMDKLPSTGDLGVQVTSYRAVREKDELRKMSHLEPGTNVAHGRRVMSRGQKHFMSTALTYNSAHWGKVREKGGIVSFSGTSGRFVNPLGVMSYVDGGEILYPPEITSRYQGSKPGGFQDAHGSLPVHSFAESSLPDAQAETVDDFHYEPDSRKQKTARALRSLTEGTDILQHARENQRMRRQPSYKAHTQEELNTLLAESKREIARRKEIDEQLRKAQLRSLPPSTPLLSGPRPPYYGT